jgi:Ca2+-binding RTX toxin-like protein
MSLPLPLLYLSKSTVPENSPHGWVVGHFELADNRYSVNLIDDAGGHFALDANNNLIVTGPLDFEEAKYQLIKVQASEGSNIVLEDVFLIQVQDVDGVSIRLDPHDAGHDWHHGRSEDDRLAGNCFANKIAGRAGDDVVRGLAGNDVLVGGLGEDRLTGNAGADHFVFRTAADSSVAAPDLINDFRHGQGDKIDLKGIAAGLLPGDHFDFVGNADFGNHAGELRFDLASHLLQGDTDGNGAADFAIEVHAANLTSGDLLL